MTEPSDPIPPNPTPEEQSQPTETIEPIEPIEPSETAAALETAEETASKKAQQKLDAARRRQAFREHVADFLHVDSATSVEEALSVQAQLLHGIFNQQLDDYVTSDRDDKAQLHAKLALKAQNYCRMTLATLLKMEVFAPPGHKRKKQKLDEQTIASGWNEALGCWNAEVDAGRTS